MDHDTATALFRSEVVDNQLTALRHVHATAQSGQVPSEDLLLELIERGMSCEKSVLVRELSFRCVRMRVCA